MMKREEKQIKLALVRKAEEVKISNELFSRVKSEINETECRRAMAKPSFGWMKKRGMVAGLACCMLVFGATAVIGSSFFQGSSVSYTSNSQYKSLPNDEQLIKDAGFAPQSVEELPGGFVFENGGVSHTQDFDVEGNVIGKRKGISFMYKAEGVKQPLHFGADKMEEDSIYRDDQELIGQEGEIDLYLYEQKYKFVPPNYELTEEDQVAVMNGELEVSYGSEEVTEEMIQGIFWYEDGISYNVMGNNFDFSDEEMMEMAKAVINE